MARFVHYEACPICRARGADNRGDNRAIYDDGGWHCFSCGDHRSGRWVPPSDLRGVVVEHGSKGVPSDATREIPAKAWQWLLQYGLSWKYWQPFVTWSEKDSRLIFACGGHSIGRYIPMEGRVRTPEPRKWWAYGDMHVHAHVLGTGGPCTVLVEDIVSAHKVGQITWTIPLFGTKVFTGVIPALRHIGLPILMWLDKDQDAVVAKRSAWLATVSGLPVRYVSTDSDPKCQSMEKIKEKINVL